jgi:transcription elongation GreA/GreB family factor
MLSKKNIHSLCLKSLEEKIVEVKNQITDLNQSFADEGKSSAGDKHETARAMAQLEVEKLHQQLHQFETQINVLKKINPDFHSETIPIAVGTGSLIKTDKGNFYIAVPLGKVDDSMVISAASPLGKEMIGKKNGDEVIFNKMKYKIENIF